MRFDAQDTELSRLHRVKQSRPPAHAPLGPEMVSFFKQSVVRRHTKLAKIAECWCALVPETLNDHCALEGLSRGSLTVIVDSSSHLYELKQLLLAGLEQQLLLACTSAGLHKISLKAGRWYDDQGGATPGDRKLRFR